MHPVLAVYAELGVFTNGRTLRVDIAGDRCLFFFARSQKKLRCGSRVADRGVSYLSCRWRGKRIARIFARVVAMKIGLDRFYLAATSFFLSPPLFFLCRLMSSYASAISSTLCAHGISHLFALWLSL